MSGKNPSSAKSEGASGVFDIAAERQRKAVSMAAPYVREEALESALLAPHFKPAEQEAIHRALEFLRNAKLVGREPNYMGHAVRVAVFYRNYTKSPTAQGVVLGLLHNVLEVTATPASDIQKQFGKWILEGCQSLVVDRERQKNDADYMARYYGKLKTACDEVQQIKIFDKLDNLLVLFLNPSAETRRQYLAEIRDCLLSLVATQLPALVPVFGELIAEAQNMPHQTLAEFLSRNPS